MNYHAVGNRCAVHLDSLGLKMTREEVLANLAQQGFQILDVDMIALARSCIGRAHYRRGALPSEAPDVFDCSSLMKWLYGQRGIWLPRRSIQQRQRGEAVSLEQISAGDLIFVSGLIDYYFNDPSDGVGHVGIATGEGTVVHAANSRCGIIESSLEDFVSDGFRGARRYIPLEVEVLTLEAPPNRTVEFSDDVMWIVLQRMGR